MPRKTWINLKWTPTGWEAMFDGGDMPQNVLTPLPFGPIASFPMVKKQLEMQFPGCFVSGSLRLHQ